MEDDGWDDELPPDAWAEMEKIEAQHQATQAQQKHSRGPQALSPPPPPAAQLAAAAAPHFQQQHYQPPPGPLQQANGGYGHKAPPPAGKHGQPLLPAGRPAFGATAAAAAAAPSGHVSMQAQAVMQQQQWQGSRPGSADLAARNRELEARVAMLTSNLQQREREAAVLKKEKAAAAAAAPAAPRATLHALDKQVEQLRQQLTFMQHELEESKRQHAEHKERTKATEALNAELQAQLQQQQEQAAAAAAAQQQQQPDRPGSAAAQRSGNHKRRQLSAGAAGDGGAQEAAADAPAAAAGGPPVAPAPPAPRLLDPQVLAAAGSLGGSTHLVAHLLAACSDSMALLAGGGAAPAAPGPGEPPAAAPTALLLRSRLAAAARAPDSDSLHFSAGFSQRVQQVAGGVLPPAALLDSIAALVAAAVVQQHHAGGGSLPPQRVRLLAAGLHVAQHLLELDSGCRAAALGGSTSAGSAGSACPGFPPRLSSRVTLTGSGAAAAAMMASAAIPGGSWQAPGSGLPDTAALLQQHQPLFAGLACEGSPLAPVALGAALWLGQQHEAVAAGALGTLAGLARALQGEGARAALAPVFTSGAMQAFMHPPALRLPALRLLHLLLEEPSLARLFEGSLAQAAAARSEPGPPTATAGTSGGASGGASGGTPGDDAEGGGGGGPQPMQVERGSGGQRGGPWTGAAAIAERLLDSFVLDEAGPLASGGGYPSHSSPRGGGRHADAGGGGGGGGAAAVPRAAMALVAALREARHRGILVYLLLDDACGAPGCMLSQRLVQLAEAALALPGEEGALQLLCPLQWPAGGGGGAADPGAPPLLHQQAAWQQRLRVAQEALTLLRGLLIDDSCGVAAMDELVCVPGASRIALTTLSRLSRLEAPPPAGEDAPPPPPLLLAPWARAIGSSTEQPSIAGGGAGGGATAAAAAGGGGGSASPLARCAVEDVVYMAKSMRRRVLSRLQSSAMQH